jgi:DGQHR domain-containing protein
LSFPAKASDILRFAVIDQVARDADGRLSGFQRPQIAAHIREIGDYLATPEAVLPNPIVVAFISGLVVKEEGTSLRVVIDISNGPPGLVVDGQQRLTALAGLEHKDFEVFVSALLCRDQEELRRQFVLINNTRPLPRTLIYELLPTVAGGLPKKLSERSVAADLTARLNYDRRSSLFGQIHQHTNPAGTLSDTAVQKFLLNSLSDGALRPLIGGGRGAERCFDLTSGFFKATQHVFPESWHGHTPSTSRLVHGAGIVSMGFVMDELHRYGADSFEEFCRGLGTLRDRAAWTQGSWDFGGGDTRHWKAIQNLNRDIMALAAHLVGIVRADVRARRARTAEEAPLFGVAGA